MSLAEEAKAAAEAIYPKTDAVALTNATGETVALLVAGKATHAMSRTPYAIGYLAGARREVTEQEVEAAARSLNPAAWMIYDQGRERNEERDLIVHRSLVQARAALEAARAAR